MPPLSQARRACRDRGIGSTSPDLDPFTDQFLPYLLAHAHHLLAEHIHDTAYRMGLSENQYRVLALLSGGTRYPLGHLAELAHVKQPTLSRVVQQMVDKGLLERTPDPDDRRVTLIAMTPAGKKAIKPVMRAADEHLQSSLAAFSDQKLEQLKALLRQLIRSISATGAQPTNEGATNDI